MAGTVVVAGMVVMMAVLLLHVTGHLIIDVTLSMVVMMTVVLLM